MSSEIDIAIIGGGNAGLTLATLLSQQTNPPQTVVIEPQTAEQRDCSWGLWAEAGQVQQLEHSMMGRWQRWQLVDHNHRVVQNSNQYNYLSLSSADYLLGCAAQLRETVTLVQESVSSVQPDGDRLLVETHNQRYHARQVYDSRPPKVIENGLRQHFLGWHIHSKQPISHPDIATLMDFRVDQTKGLHFIYALPFSDHHMLVESTLISRTEEERDWYRSAIEGWLRDNDIEVENLIHEEAGVIPMDQLEANPHAGESRIAAIGAASGAVRRSSGYAFQHIQQQVGALADGIAKGDMRVPPAISSQLTSMDRLFNGVLLNRPDLAISLYMRMAQALNGDQFARFMLGRATLSDWMRVIMAMPKIPFLRQLLHA